MSMLIVPGTAEEVEVVYMALLCGIDYPPPTVAIFKSLKCAEDFCRSKNDSIPTDNVCHLIVRQMTMGAPSKEEFSLRINPSTDITTWDRIDRLRGPDIIFQAKRRRHHQ